MLMFKLDARRARVESVPVFETQVLLYVQFKLLLDVPLSAFKEPSTI